MIDTHAHLDALEDADGALARAREAGVSRVITIGTGLASCRAALELAAANDGVYAALGIDPHQAGSDEEHRVGELRELLGNERAVAVGETGLDYHYGSETKDEQRRLFEAQLGLARELRLPVVIHTREANDDTESMLRAHDGTVVMHCFSEPGLLAAGLERGWYFSFAGNVTYPRAEELREAAAEVPADRILAETDSPYLSPQPLRGKPNEPAHVVHTVAALAAARGEDADELTARIDANATAAFGLAVSVSPKKQLGQHFLADENILGVIGRLAELGHDDVALEIGPGLGVLTRYLAEHVSHVHAVELDRSLEPHLAELAERRTSTSTGATRSRSTWLRSSPRRRSSSRTCPTTWRRRSSPRASPACRASSCGA